MENKKNYKTCPSELEISDYLDGRLNQEREERLLKHVSQCYNCLTLLELGHKADEGNFTQPTAKMIEQAKNIIPGKEKIKVLTWLWPSLAGVCFICSFAVGRFFLQFVVLAVIFSIKWIFDTGSTRTLIMIYQAWRKKGNQTTQDGSCTCSRISLSNRSLP